MTDSPKPPPVVSFAMMCSLDGYIAGPEGGPQLPPPDEPLHRYWNDLQRDTSAVLYGRAMYEIMSYWDTAEENPESGEVELEFARAWKATPKIVFSTTLEKVGPNARLVRDDARGTVEEVKRTIGGRIEVAGPCLAASLQRLGLIDEYRLYLLPFVLGGGKPFFEAGSDLALEYAGSERLPQDVTMLRYRPKKV